MAMIMRLVVRMIMRMIMRMRMRMIMMRMVNGSSCGTLHWWSTGEAANGTATS